MTHQKAKQNITKKKIEKFFATYPRIFFLQHNNLSVPAWQKIRTQLAHETSEILVLKNTAVENFLGTKISQTVPFRSTSVPSIFQGPCFALGISNTGCIKTILKILSHSSCCFLVGGIFDHQFLTHLDIAKLRHLNSGIYSNLLQNFQQSETLCGVLASSWILPETILPTISQDFLFCLHHLKNTLEQKQKSILLKKDGVYCLSNI